ncbi:MBL fold metallo-hydrolase [Pelomonas sp. CA6]|uniref:MBL fold metallo-hydrolase n=1 Tax=Pelomonas sp. CA6 TaxID=2907999 RepID=UPI001F4BDFC5|nr:MBL fold metallo-hydrolase [Pelomonas sp. CA6]MCH7345374.1 MBL fold metallo-hydrolase [Pelomonas sp. CA6]
MKTKTLSALDFGVRNVPLVNAWFAHPYLVSPLTFGLYTRHSHLAMLESFLDDPAQHRESARRPELLGGPFINDDGDPADMAHFRDRTLERCAPQLRAADAINAMFQMLQTQAKGAGVPPLYAQIDPLIRPGVELAYDVAKQPSPRFIEPVFYGGPLCDPSLQSCVLERASDQPRSFILSTPQIRRSEASVALQLPFGDPLWNELHGGTEDLPALLERLRPHLADAARELPLLRSMMRELGPGAARDTGPADGVRIRYFGHACVLMEGAGISLLVDPLLSYPGESRLEHYTFDDLPERLDYVLITHPHQDHIVFETLLRLRPRVDRVVVGKSGGGSLPDVSLKLMLQHCGFERVIELGEYETLDIPGGRIVGAPFYGEHADLDVRGKLAFGVQMREVGCLFFADSNPPEPEFYEPLRRLMPRVDCLFLGMECVGAPATWLYGPLLQKMLTRGEDQSRRLDGCNADKALRMHRFFEPQRLFIYAMGAEPWLTHLTSILYSEDSTQFREAREVERTLRAQGRQAELLFGQRELLL